MIVSVLPSVIPAFVHSFFCSWCYTLYVCMGCFESYCEIIKTICSLVINIINICGYSAKFSRGISNAHHNCAAGQHYNAVSTSFFARPMAYAYKAGQLTPSLSLYLSRSNEWEHFVLWYGHCASVASLCAADALTLHTSKQTFAAFRYTHAHSMPPEHIHTAANTFHFQFAF